MSGSCFWACCSPKVDHKTEVTQQDPCSKDLDAEDTAERSQIDPEPAKFQKPEPKAQLAAAKTEVVAPPASAASARTGAEAPARTRQDVPAQPAPSHPQQPQPQTAKQGEPKEEKKEKGLQERKLEEFLRGRANLAAISETFADVGGRRRPSCENIALDQYVHGHSDVFDKLLAAEKDPRWVPKKSVDGLEVFQFFDDALQMAAVKGVIEMNCGSQGGLEYILAQMLAPSKRPEYDETCLMGKLVEQRLPYYRVSYFQLGTPTPIISNRDVLLLGRLRFLEDGSLLVAIESTEHPDIPPNPDFVRLNIPAGGYILRPTGNPDVYQVTFVAVADLGGWLPGWLKRLVAWKQSLALLKFKQAYKL